MSTAILRAELESGRVLTFVADDQAETIDDAPRVYLGSRTELVHDGATSRYVTNPTVEFDELSFSPERAEELARRLLIAAANVRARCSCGHRWWEHLQGRSCSHVGPRGGVVCRCSMFSHEIAQVS